jgi:curved DNA-binding protein CbpA
MTDLEQAYRTLGLEPGASFREVMEAHSDLVTVWDPKRFTDTPRLERKALRELQAINEAFELIRSQLPIKSSSGHPSAASTNRTTDRPGGPASTARGPAAPSGSLYESTFEPGARRRNRIIWLAIGGLAVLIALFLVFSENSDGPDPNSTPDTEEPLTSEVTPEQAQPAAVTTGPNETTPPVPSSDSTKNGTATQASEPSRPSAGTEPAQPTLPIRRAFELLQKRSEVARTLVEKGRYLDLQYQRWQVTRTKLPEIAIDIVTQKTGQASQIHLIWAVNLETQTIRPTSPALVELMNRDSGPKPALVRQF